MTGKIKKICAPLLLALLAFSIAACGGAPPVKNRELGGDLLIVGRIDILPPLSEREQELKGIGSGRYKNRGYLFFSDRPVDLYDFGMGDAGHAELADLNKHVVITRPRFEDIYYSGAVIIMNNNRADYLRLPGVLTYKIRPDDRAVYIGTLRYHRDDYNTITKVEYVDEFDQALAVFQKSAGNSKKALRKVKPEPRAKAKN